MNGQGLEWLKATPEAQYMAFMPQFRAPRAREYYETQYAPVYRQYLGALGRQAMQGMEPTMEFGSFLSQYPWLAEYYRMGPSQRGERPAQFGPRARWLLW